MEYKRIKCIYFAVISFLFLYCYFHATTNKFMNKNNFTRSELIEENFFIIDSNNLEYIKSHMYGFSISKLGFLTDNYYKTLGHYEDPEYLGAYIMIRILGNEIIINQDYYGSYGLYIYENKESEYFAISNSFLLLGEYLVEKQNISLNKDFVDNFLISGLYSDTIYETMINEIIRIPSNAFIIINKKNKLIKIKYMDYEENTIKLESKKGREIIDKWIDKWTYIIRSIKKKSKNIIFDVSGGFDTRAVLAILLNSGLDLKEISFYSTTSKARDLPEDFKIAELISSKLDFNLNKYNFDKNYIKWTVKDKLFGSLYSKLGFHKDFYINRGFYKQPILSFGGGGGEFIKGSPGLKIGNYIEMLSSRGNDIIGHDLEFFNSSMRLCLRSVNLLKEKKNYNNDFEISFDFYSRILQNHFGKRATEGFISNFYYLYPLMDPDIRRIKYDINCETSHDLIAYIYVRFAPELVNIPFQGNRTINPESIKKAKKLNNQLQPYEIKKDFCKNYFLDNKKFSSVYKAKINYNAQVYLKKLFYSHKFIRFINKIYDKNIYNWVKKDSLKSNIFNMRPVNGLITIAIIEELLILNEKYMKKLNIKLSYYKENIIINDIMKQI